MRAIGRAWRQKLAGMARFYEARCAASITICATLGLIASRQALATTASKKAL